MIYMCDTKEVEKQKVVQCIHFFLSFCFLLKEMNRILFFDLIIVADK